MLGIPERGHITVHIKGNTATVSYGVTGSSMRINLGAAFAHIFKGENKATITIKASENIIELFHKEDEQSLFPIFKKSARYADGWRFCSECQCFYQDKCPTHGIKLRNSPRKKKKKLNIVFRGAFHKLMNSRKSRGNIFTYKKRQPSTWLSRIAEGLLI
jgi:hypothetical protein